MKNSKVEVVKIIDIYDITVKTKDGKTVFYCGEKTPGKFWDNKKSDFSGCDVSVVADVILKDMNGVERKKRGILTCDYEDFVEEFI